MDDPAIIANWQMLAVAVGGGLLDVFGLDTDIVTQAMQNSNTRQEAHESARNRAR